MYQVCICALSIILGMWYSHTMYRWPTLFIRNRSRSIQNPTHPPPKKAERKREKRQKNNVRSVIQRKKSQQYVANKIALPLVSPFHEQLMFFIFFVKSAHQPPKNPTKHRKARRNHRMGLSWQRVPTTHCRLSPRSLCGKCCLRSCILLRRQKASNSRTTFPIPGIWYFICSAWETESSRTCWLPISRGGRKRPTSERKHWSF